MADENEDLWPVEGQWPRVEEQLIHTAMQVASVLDEALKLALAGPRRESLAVYLRAAEKCIRGARDAGLGVITVSPAISAHDELCDPVLDGSKTSEEAAKLCLEANEIAVDSDIDTWKAEQRGLTLREYRLVSSIADLVLLQDPYYPRKFKRATAGTLLRTADGKETVVREVGADGRLAIQLISDQSFPGQTKPATIYNTWYLEKDMRPDNVVAAFEDYFKKAVLPEVETATPAMQQLPVEKFEKLVEESEEQRRRESEEIYEKYPATAIKPAEWPVIFEKQSEKPHERSLRRTLTWEEWRSGEFRYTVMLDQCRTWSCWIERKVWLTKWIHKTGIFAGRESDIHALFSSRVDGAATKEKALEAALAGAMTAGWVL